MPTWHVSKKLIQGMQEVLSARRIFEGRGRAFEEVDQRGLSAKDG